MINGKMIVVVLPAYNAEKTIKLTVNEIDREIVDKIILMDDNSSDQTINIGLELDLIIYKHNVNLGYGGNQKSCYAIALSEGADIIIMVHPDYQYTPKLIPVMAWMLAHDLYDVVLASRILGGKALQGGMPIYKYVANRFLTFIENILTGMKLSEFHTGFRAFTKKTILNLPLNMNSNDFIFDNQILLQIHSRNFRIAEISCPTKYFNEASSINLKRSVIYGIGCLKYAFIYFIYRLKLINPVIFDKKTIPDCNFLQEHVELNSKKIS